MFLVAVILFSILPWVNVQADAVPSQNINVKLPVCHDFPIYWNNTYAPWKLLTLTVCVDSIEWQNQTSVLLHLRVYQDSVLPISVSNIGAQVGDQNNAMLGFAKVVQQQVQLQGRAWTSVDAMIVSPYSVPQLTQMSSSIQSVKGEASFSWCLGWGSWCAWSGTYHRQDILTRPQLLALYEQYVTTS